MTKMNTLSRTFAVLSVAFATSAFATEDASLDVLPASGDDITEFREAGKWMIYQNNTRGHCMMTRSSEDGKNVVQMGITKDGNYGYVGVFSKDFAVEEGEKEIAIAVNGNIYVGLSEGVTQNLTGGYQGGYVVTNSKKFIQDLKKGDELVAYPDAPYAAKIDLKGASNAIFEVRKCTDELQAN